MGVGGISIWQLLIVLVIILLLFGTKKLRSIGTDLGSAVKGFRNSLRDEERRDAEEAATIEHKQTHKTENPSQRQQDDADFKIKSGNDENK